MRQLQVKKQKKLFLKTMPEDFPEQYRKRAWRKWKKLYQKSKYTHI